MSQYKSGQKVYVTGLLKEEDGWERDSGEATLLNYDNGIWTTKRVNGKEKEGEKVYENKEEYDKWVESHDKTDSRYYIDKEKTKKTFSSSGRIVDGLKHIRDVTYKKIRDLNDDDSRSKLYKIRNLNVERKKLPFNEENREEYNKKTDEMNDILKSLKYDDSKTKILNEIQPKHDLTYFHRGGRKSRRVKKSKRKRTKKSKTKKRRSNRRK